MMRLQKYLALSGVASRRASEKLIAEGHVAVNGQVITEMGVQVDENTDRITVDGTPVHLEEEKHYLAYNKPVGEVTTATFLGRRGSCRFRPASNSPSAARRAFSASNCW